MYVAYTLCWSATLAAACFLITHDSPWWAAAILAVGSSIQFSRDAGRKP